MFTVKRPIRFAVVLLSTICVFAWLGETAGIIFLVGTLVGSFEMTETD